MAEETRAEKARRIARERIAAGESKVVASTFEVSTKGSQLGKEFSALNATFKEGIFAGKTIEEVWQNDIKKSGKGRPPTKDSILFGKPISESKKIYQQLWQKWANENPDKILELKKIVDEGTKLTDSFAGNPDRTVNQAEALTNVIKNTNNKIPKNIDINKIINNPSFIDGITSHTEFFMGIKNKLELQGFEEKDVDNIINKYMDEIGDSYFMKYEFNPDDIEEAGSFVREYTRPKSQGGSLGAAMLNDPNVFTDAAMIVPDVKISKLLKNKAKLLAIDGINALDVYEIGLILGALIEPGVEKALNPIMPILFPGIDKEKIKDNKSYKEQVIENLQMTAKISPTDIALDKYNEKNSSKLGMDSIVMTQLTPNIGRVPRKIKKSRYNKDYNWIEGLING